MGKNDPIIQQQEEARRANEKQKQQQQRLNNDGKMRKPYAKVMDKKYTDVEEAKRHMQAKMKRPSRKINYDAFALHNKIEKEMEQREEDEEEEKEDEENGVGRRRRSKGI